MKKNYRKKCEKTGNPKNTQKSIESKAKLLKHLNLTELINRRLTAKLIELSNIATMLAEY